MEYLLCETDSNAKNANAPGNGEEPDMLAVQGDLVKWRSQLDAFQTSYLLLCSANRSSG